MCFERRSVHAGLVFRVILAAGLVCLVGAACTGSGQSSAEPTATPPTATRPASTPTATPEPTVESPYAPGWTAIHADAANSDYSPSHVADELEIQWRRSFDGAITVGSLEWTINVGPTIGPDGLLYLTTTVPGCHFQAIEIATGETAWCSAEVGLQAVISSALIGRDGTAYLADAEAMRAFDSTGRVLWETPIVGVPLSAQFTPFGRVIFITHVGVAYVLDASTGEPAMQPLELVPGATWDGVGGLWDCARGLEGCPSANTIAVDHATGRVFFTFWEPGAPQAGLRAMQLTESAEEASLSPLWENVSLPGGSASSPALSADGSRVYVTDNVDSMHALDAATGAIVWSYAFGAASGGSLSVSPGGVLMAAGGDLQAVQDDGEKATLLWRREGVVNRGIATQAHGNRAYATVRSTVAGASQYANDLVVIDTRTGTELSRVSFEGPTIFSIGITIGADGTVFVPFIQGDLYALAATSE